jgi:hypothetical protein
MQTYKPLTQRQKLIRDFTLAMIENPGTKRAKVEAAREYADLIINSSEIVEEKKRTFVNGGN